MIDNPKPQKLLKGEYKMHCKFCGEKMSRSDDICTTCGRLKSMPLEPKPDYSNRDPGKSQEFFSLTKNILFRYLPFILLLPFGFLFISLFQAFGGYDREVIITVFAVAAVAAIITVISASKCYVSVYKNCITGRIPAKIPCFSKKFTVYYEDIIKLRTQGIGTGSNSFKHSTDSHPKFVIVTKSGAISIKGLTDSQALSVQAYIRAFRDK